MALIGEIVFTDDTPQDTQGGTVTTAAADENKMRFASQRVRGFPYTVMHQPNAESAESRAFPVWTAPSIDDVSEWSVEILCRLPWPAAMGALFRFPAGVIRSYDGNIDEFGATVAAPQNTWFLFTLRHSADGSDAYIDDVRVGDIASVDWEGGTCHIGAWDNSIIPNAEIAFIKLYDHVLGTPTSVSNPADDNTANLLGALWREEVDGGDQNLMTAVGEDGVDITFCGVACWGGLYGMLTNEDYLRLSATIDWDDYILGTGHIADTMALIEVTIDHARHNYRARIVCDFDNGDTNVITGVYAEVYDDTYTLDTRTLLTTTADPDTEYHCEIEITEDDVNFVFGDNELTIERPFTDFDSYLIGMNLGMHFGPDWDMRLRNVEVLQYMTERGWNARKAFLKIFNQNIIGGY